MMNKPYKTYNGGKESDGTFQKIISIMPPHDIYCELFVGNGAIFRKKKEAKYTILNDIDETIAIKWDRKSDFTNDDQRIWIGCTDAIQWLKDFELPAAILKSMGIQVLIYLDPPYPMDCRKTDRQRYQFEMTDDQHFELLHLISRGYPAKIVISSYPNKLYWEYLQGWSTFTFTAQTRGCVMTEQVWYNYPQPTELHDYRYLGSDYRDRERIKGIVNRNLDKIKRMPDLERNLFITKILDIYERH